MCIQDYNKEVLTELCAPTVAANLAARSAQPQGQRKDDPVVGDPAPRYFAGAVLRLA